MILTTSLLLTVLSLRPAAAAQTPLLGEMGRMMDLFDGGRTPMPRVAPPAPGSSVRGPLPVDRSQWAPVPEVAAGAAIAPNDGQAGDAFAGLEPCAVVDAVYIRQPSLPEATAALQPCLDAVSKRYGASTVARAEEKSLVLRIPVTAADGPLAKDLAAALAARKGRLMGHPARLSAELSSVQPKGTSVLQPVIDRCAGPKMLPVDADGFVAVYGACLTSAKGLGITAVKPHPTDSRAVIVVSTARFETLLDMSGLVTVPTAPGTGRFRIEARREVSARLPVGG